MTRSTLRLWIAPVLCALFVVVFSASLLTLSQDRHPLSLVDEHIHFDTAIRTAQGGFPARGDLLTQELVDEWACGVGHEAGDIGLPCGDPQLTPDAVPSGTYTTGYIHYPTYFLGAAAFQPVWATLTGNDDRLDGYRAYSAVTMIAGVLACALMAWLLGLRGAGLIAATALPVAASQLVFSGTIVNPVSMSILTGALIGGTGLLWVTRGRGFVWFALATAFGASIAVTASLPAGGIALAMLAVLIGRRFGWGIAPQWEPRWWHLVVTGAIVLAPIVVWGRVIAATATIPNETLYGFLPKAGLRDVLVGATRELTSPHTPWRSTDGIYANPEGFIARIIHAFSQGSTGWITILVFGVLVAVAFVVLSRKEADALTPEAGGIDRGIVLVAAATILTVVLYPPALRISNWLTFGFDYPIVDRYSAAFSAVLAVTLVAVSRLRSAPTTLAVLGTVTALGVVAAGWG